MLTEYRKQIDAIDDELIKLYGERMAISKQIGIEKSEAGTAILDGGREREILSRMAKASDPQILLYVKQLFSTLFETGKAYQRKFTDQSSLLPEELVRALSEEELPFPATASVACQGAEGSFSSLAADKMFAIPDNTFFKTFQGVFNAVEKGLCEYGVLPIENSTVGSVNEVYDLMKEHRFYIVRAVKLPVAHSLLAKKGTELEDIKEIYSHEQALGQCSKFLKSLSDKVKITVFENTASAAKAVAASGRKDLACIAARNCAELYGLGIIKTGVQNNERNFTRFICISKKPHVFEAADKISIMVNLPHEPGSLNGILNKFYALGLNLTKLESRPIEKSEFDFMFYFDFEADIRRLEVKSLIAELYSSLAEFTFLGSYKEIK